MFTNSAEQLRDALDRNVDKEMAVEAVRESNTRDAPPREEGERLVCPANREASGEQSFDPGTASNSGEAENVDKEIAGQETEFEMNS